MPPFPSYYIMCKDLRLIFRDRSALIFLFGLPLVFAFLFGTAFGGSGSRNAGRSPIKVLVANEDAGPHGQEFLDAMQRLGVAVEKAVDSHEVGKRVRTGERAVGVIVPSDFSMQLDHTVAVATSLSSTPDKSQAHLRLLIDPAQLQIANLAQGAISGAAQRLAGNLIRKRVSSLIPGGADAGNSDRLPVALDIVRAADADQTSVGTAKESPGDLVIPGLAVYFVFFTANGVAATLMTERQEGTLRRMLCAPITPGQILLGKMLARGLLGLVQVALLFSVGKMLIHFSLGSSLPGLILTAVATVFAATGLGLLIATFGKTLDQIQGMTTFALLLMGLLSGCLFPRILLPEMVQKLSIITPHAWALNAYQDLLLRNLPLSATLLNIGMVVLFGLVFYGFALVRFKYE